MKITRDSLPIATKNTSIQITMLASKRSVYRHELKIWSNNIALIQNMFFDVVKGKYELNKLGKKFGAQITSSTYTLSLNPYCNKRELYKKLIKVDPSTEIRVIRYQTV